MADSYRGPKTKSFSSRIDYVLAIEGVSIFATSSHIVCVHIYIYIYVPYIHLITHTSYTATLYFCTKADFHSFKDSLRPQIVRSYGIANKICPGSFSKSMPRQFQNDRIQRFIKMEQGALAQKGHRAVGFLTGTFST